MKEPRPVVNQYNNIERGLTRNNSVVDLTSLHNSSGLKPNRRLVSQNRQSVGDLPKIPPRPLESLLDDVAKHFPAKTRNKKKIDMGRQVVNLADVLKDANDDLAVESQQGELQPTDESDL